MLSRDAMLSSGRLPLVFFLASALSVGCETWSPPRGMRAVAPRPHAENPTLEELARAEPAGGQRSLLVVFPRRPCSGSAATVLLDATRTFYGAVGPGQAALLTVPAGTRTLYAMSVVDIVAQPRTWFVEADEVRLEPAPSGIFLEGPHGKQCGKWGAWSNARAATKEELETELRETVEVHWLAPDLAAGQTWLDAHKTRVGEMLARLPR